jgi:hypothetical protein
MSVVKYVRTKRRFAASIKTFMMESQMKEVQMAGQADG